jgi:hypothetical protein
VLGISCYVWSHWFHLAAIRIQTYSNLQTPKYIVALSVKHGIHLPIQLVSFLSAPVSFLDFTEDVDKEKCQIGLDLSRSQAAR